MASKGVGAVITGAVGPEAYRVLAAAGIPTYVFGGRTVREAIEAFRAGRLAPVDAPTGPAHAGMGAMRGWGPGRASAPRGPHGNPSSTPAASTTPSAGPAAAGGASNDEENLKAELRDLRRRLREVEDRIDEQGRKR